MKTTSRHEPTKRRQGFGVRQCSGAFVLAGDAKAAGDCRSRNRYHEGANTCRLMAPLRDFRIIEARRPTNAPNLSAFTLIELFVVMVVIAILASLLLPALANTNAKGQSVACLNNLKQLQLAWQMYVDDHDGTMSPNIISQSGAVWRDLPGSGVLGNAKRDVAVSNIESGVLFPYARSPRIYRWPANRTVANVSFGTNVSVIRTYVNKKGRLVPSSSDTQPV